MEKGKVYRIGIRRVVNKPEWVSHQTLKFDGINHRGQTCWYPVGPIEQGQKVVELYLDQIAELEAVA